MHFRGIRRRLLALCGGGMHFLYAPRKFIILLFIIFIVVFTAVVLSIVDSRVTRENLMSLRLADMQAEVQFLRTMYRTRQEELLRLQDRLTDQGTSGLRNISGTRTATGLSTSKVNLRNPFVYQLLPHLMDDPQSLFPAYHLKGNKNYTDYVFGIPTVRRDKENYLIITLEHLLQGLKNENSTLIVVFVGETDLEYVVQIAKHIEARFPKQVESGMIEVISPSKSYYPDLYKEKPTLGDSPQRFRWRTKQNLDAIFLMAYAQTKGTYYLMLEDDVICKPNYMDTIKQYTASVTASNLDWVFIEYCAIGAIGKLFKSSDLTNIITFLQLFYRNMPIDWLIERYVENRACSIEIGQKECKEKKLQMRPRYASPLFQHIGLFSSLKGKIQKVKDSHFGKIPKYYPHNNPPVDFVNTTIKVHGSHTILDAYLGLGFFWGLTPKSGDTVMFCFKQPKVIESYLFRSGNIDHFSDKFRHSVIEVLPYKQQNFTEVGSFDEFGLAEGTVNKEIGPVECISIRVTKDLATWVILSEISLKTSWKPDFVTNASTNRSAKETS